MVVMLGGLGHIDNEVEFLILKKSKASCVRSLQLLRDRILHDKRIVRHHTRDAPRALPLHLQLGRAALAMFRVKHVVFYLEVRRSHVFLFVVLLSRSFEIAI
jgi:hypothetical protein